MTEITINDVKYTNVPNKKAGTKFASALTQSNISVSQSVADYMNSAYFYTLVNAVDINWNGIEVAANSYINTTSDLIKFILSVSNVDLSDYATMSYVQEALSGKANVGDVYTKTEVDKLIPAPVDLSNYVSYTDANSYYMTVEGPKQVINSSKTFVGNKRINFRQGTSSDKLGFTLYNSDENEVGGFEWRSGTINGNPLISLQHYVSTANMSIIPQSYLGFRQTQGNNKYHLVAPIPGNVAKIETITSSNYKNFFMPLVFKNGGNKIYTDCTGLVDLSSLMPNLNDYTTRSYVTTELNKKADKTDIVQADMCETDTTSKSYVLNNPYQYHIYNWYGSKYYCYNLIIPHNTSFDNTNISNSNTKNCVIIGNYHNIYKGLNSCLIQGYKNTIQNDYEVAFGQYNSSTHHTSDSSLKTVFSIGNGDSVSRHNALEVKGDGQIYIADTEDGTPYSLQSKLNSKADANNVYTKTEVDNLIPAPVDLSSYTTTSYVTTELDKKADKTELPDMTQYVSITSYNALAARVEQLASWIVSYHSSYTPTPSGIDPDIYFDNSELTVDYNMEPNKLNGYEITQALNGNDASSGAWIVWSTDNSSIATVHGGYVVAQGNGTVNIIAEYTAHDTYNYKKVEYNLTIVNYNQKQSPTGGWYENGNPIYNLDLVEGNTSDKTLTFSATPNDSWTFGDPGMVGVSVNTTTGEINITGASVQSSEGSVSASRMEDASYYSGNMMLMIRVLPSGTDLNFHFDELSVNLDNQAMTTQTPILTNYTSIDTKLYPIQYVSADTNVANVDSNGMISFVGGGTTTITATISDGNETHTATITVYCTVNKQYPSVSFEYNGTPYYGGTLPVVAPFTGTIQLTNMTPSDGWVITDPMIQGITVLQNVIEVQDLSKGQYNINVDRPEDSDYYSANISLVLKVLPSGSNINFFYDQESVNLDNQAMSQSTPMLYNNTGFDAMPTYKSADIAIATVDENGMISFVSGGTTTVTASITNGTDTYTTSITVICNAINTTLNVDTSRLNARSNNNGGIYFDLYSDSEIMKVETYTTNNDFVNSLAQQEPYTSDGIYNYKTIVDMPNEKGILDSSKVNCKVIINNSGTGIEPKTIELSFQNPLIQ